MVRKMVSLVDFHTHSCYSESQENLEKYQIKNNSKQKSHKVGKACNKRRTKTEPFFQSRIFVPEVLFLKIHIFCRAQATNELPNLIKMMTIDFQKF